MVVERVRFPLYPLNIKGDAHDNSKRTNGWFGQYRPNDES